MRLAVQQLTPDGGKHPVEMNNRVRISAYWTLAGIESSKWASWHRKAPLLICHHLKSLKNVLNLPNLFSCRDNITSFLRRAESLFCALFRLKNSHMSFYNLNNSTECSHERSWKLFLPLLSLLVIKRLFFYLFKIKTQAPRIHQNKLFHVIVYSQKKHTWIFLKLPKSSPTPIKEECIKMK